MRAVSKATEGARSVLGEIKRHWVWMILFGLLFAAFLFPIIAKWLGTLKAKGGTVAKLIPAAFTKAS